jgi:hypothetical protein
VYYRRPPSRLLWFAVGSASMVSVLGYLYYREKKARMAAAWKGMTEKFRERRERFKSLRRKEPIPVADGANEGDGQKQTGDDREVVCSQKPKSQRWKTVSQSSYIRDVGQKNLCKERNQR